MEAAVEPRDRRLRVAVVGSGAAGLTAAYLLQARHDVTVFERNDYAGGHAHTVTVPGGPDAGMPVDIGFVVMNHEGYPLFTRLLDRLGVALHNSDRSFGYHDQLSGLQYSCRDLNGLFAQRRNIVRPRFHRMVRDILRFRREAEADLAAGVMAGLSIGEYLAEKNYSDLFRFHHLAPLGAAIWSMPSSRMMHFPAESLVQCLRNHGLLRTGRQPQWKTVAGGARRYVEELTRTLKEPVRTRSAVDAVRRLGAEIRVETRDGAAHVFDRVVIAAHADEALGMLADPSPDEKRLLGAWTYERNWVHLHTDESVMPPLRRAWSSWNFTREDQGHGESVVSLTYWLNRLQGLRAQKSYFVSLNRSCPIPESRVLLESGYLHPAYTFESLETREELPSLNGRRGTYFCGSYFGCGFHEDAVRSAVQVGRAFGTDLS